MKGIVLRGEEERNFPDCTMFTTRNFHAYDNKSYKGTRVDERTNAERCCCCCAFAVVKIHGIRNNRTSPTEAVSCGHLF